MPQKIYLSVHDIVDLLLRRGHLDTRIFNQSSMQEGTRLHSLYQSEQNADYISEYPLNYTFEKDEFIFVVNGKADGVIIKEDGSVTVDEIKTTVADLDEFIKDHGEWHLGQAMLYAFIIADERKLTRVNITMTYLRQQNYRIRKRIEKSYSYPELKDFTDGLIEDYANYMRKVIRLKKERNESLEHCRFPFSYYREGQKEMIDFVYQAAEEQKEAYIEAPTGIGKTISVLYPMISRFGERKADRILYLTSKNSIKKVAMSALNLFTAQGAKMKSIEFTSKENLCFNDRKGHCNPDECPFAKNYYDKLYDAIFDSLEENDVFDRGVIERIGYSKNMCPFQFQLDLSKYCDVLVLDYTYVFDYHDRLSLQEGAYDGSKSYLLVDECHNLPDRVRDMHSIEFYRTQMEDALSLCIGKEFDELKADIKDAISLFDKIDITDPEKTVNDSIYLLENIPEKFLSDLSDIVTDMKSLMKKCPHLLSDNILEFFYLVNSFCILSELTNSEELESIFLKYMITESGKSIGIRIAALDSRPLIRSCSVYFSSTIYFSATLSPKDYYIDLLGGNPGNKDDILILPSPFPKENRRVFINSDLSLKYKDRNATLYQVYSLCRTAVTQKKGNYFIFCPSFEYLDRMVSFFQQEEDEDLEIVVQTRFMKEDDRDEFLLRFREDNEKTLVGIMVIGGVFSEGIDLMGDRLIGACIISVGLPQIGFERDKIKEYYDGGEENSRKGFNYSYTYPGMNRVLQAAGRVIRSESDRGFIFLIDSRYRTSTYASVFQEIYPDAIKISSSTQLKNQLQSFWRENEQ